MKPVMAMPAKAQSEKVNADMSEVRPETMRKATYNETII